MGMTQQVAARPDGADACGCAGGVTSEFASDITYPEVHAVTEEYERARYSVHPVTDEDVQKVRETIKVLGTRLEETSRK